jgi:aromatic-L-amino-acid decarboxylase
MLADEYDLWFHVDGAFGALAAWSAHRGLVAGQERADSLAFDLHKWGYMPYEVGVVLTRDRTAQTAAYGRPGVDGPAYLRSAPRGISVDTTYFADRGMQLSRGFRALKVWMSMKEQGVDRIGFAIGRNIDQAKRLSRLVAEHPALEIMAPVPMNIVCFRYVGDGDRALDLDAINQEIVATLQVHGLAVPSQTVLQHGFAIRVCITNHRSDDSDFDLLVDEVVRIGSRLRADALSAG